MPSSPQLAHFWQAIWIGIFGTFTIADWQGLLGCTIPVVSALWALMPPDEVAALDLQPEHLLWFLAWLYKYDTWIGEHNRWRVRENLPHTCTSGLASPRPLLEPHLPC